MQSILNPKLTTDSTGKSFDSPIRVVVIEDIRELREGLQSLLNLTTNFKCVKSFGAMDEALRFIEADTADLILTDIGLPRLNGIEARGFCAKNFPNCRLSC